MNEFAEFFVDLWVNFRWFIELGYIIIIATILTMLLTQLWKKTFLKKTLAKVVTYSEDEDLNEKMNSNRKDKILGLTGTITSLVLYALVYFANAMIIQGTFFISMEWTDGSFWLQILSGASITWVAAKGLYTVIHKFIDRIKDGKLTKEEVNDTKADLDEVAKAVEATKTTPLVSTPAVGAKTTSATKKSKTKSTTEDTPTEETTKTPRTKKVL